MRTNLRRNWYQIQGHDRWSVPATDLRVRTDDGVGLVVTRLGAEHDIAVVVAHSFLGYRSKPAWRRLCESLSKSFRVYALDLRGHGQSDGECSGGPLEALDVRAVVALARAEGCAWVATVGGSLGGAAVIFEAASSASSDLVCAISPPSRWVRDLLHEPTLDGGALRRQILWMFGSLPAQMAARVAFGTRITRGWAGTEPPIEVVDRIRVPFMLVHGEDDHLFPASVTVDMFKRAIEPKQLVLRDRFGHCEDGFDLEFCDWLRGALVSAASEGLPIRGAS